MEDRMKTREVRRKAKLVSIARDSAFDREGTEVAMVKLVRGACCLDVATQQLDELIMCKWRCSGDMLIVGTSLLVLGFLELSAQLVMRAIELLCNVSGSRYSGALSEVRFKSGVKAKVGEEGGLLCGQVLTVVECELGEWQVVDPIVLLVGRVGLEVLLKCLVHVLSQSVHLRVVSC